MEVAVELIRITGDLVAVGDIRNYILSFLGHFYDMVKHNRTSIQHMKYEIVYSSF